MSRSGLSVVGEVLLELAVKPGALIAVLNSGDLTAIRDARYSLKGKSIVKAVFERCSYSLVKI